MKNIPSFISPSLQKIDSEAESVVSCHLQDLERASSDIRALEFRLEKAGIPFKFTYHLFDEDRKYYALCNDLGWSYNGLFHESKEHCLVWDKNGKGEYQLLYNIYIVTDEFDEHDEDGQEKKERFRKRVGIELEYSRLLIETKSYFRLKIEKELPFFYKSIINALKSKKHESQVWALSPTYNNFIPSSKAH